MLSQLVIIVKWIVVGCILLFFLLKADSDKMWFAVTSYRKAVLYVIRIYRVCWSSSRLLPPGVPVLLPAQRNLPDGTGWSSSEWCWGRTRAVAGTVSPALFFPVETRPMQNPSSHKPAFWSVDVQPGEKTHTHTKKFKSMQKLVFIKVSVV